ncbi:MAG: alpha/beta hydrolase [Candidatus Pacebacteria bacterium]|nr:alpha/beta hydrolase [Candidatus Paceibacterota bacterium]
MNKKTIKIQGLKIVYKKEGTGTPIMILHGWGGSSKSWERIIELLSEKKYMVVCPDLPGFGESETPKEPWNINRYISFVLDFLESQDIEECILLGHSFGGGLATKISSEYPKIINKLILCDAAVVRSKERLSLRQKVAKMAANIAKPLVGNKLYQEKIQPKLRPFVYKVAGTRDYYSANEIMKKTFKQVFAEDLKAFLSNIRKPTLIVWGKEDVTTPLEDAFEIGKMIEYSEVQVMEGVKHSPHLTKPEDLAKIIIEFLNKKYD